MPQYNGGTAATCILLSKFPCLTELERTLRRKDKLCLGLNPSLTLVLQVVYRFSRNISPVADKSTVLSGRFKTLTYSGIPRHPVFVHFGRAPGKVMRLEPLEAAVNLTIPYGGVRHGLFYIYSVAADLLRLNKNLQKFLVVCHIACQNNLSSPSAI